MPEKRLVSKDPATGKETWCHFLEDGTFHFETTQQVGGIIDHARDAQNNFRPGDLIGNTQKHVRRVAEIPTGLYYELVHKLGRPQHNKKAWARWLNDPDNRYFRTSTDNI